MSFFRLPFFILLLLKQWHTLRIRILTKSVSFQKTFVLVKNIDFCKEKKKGHVLLKSHRIIFFSVLGCVSSFQGFSGFLCTESSWTERWILILMYSFFLFYFLPFFFFTLVAKIPFVFQVLNGLENTLHNSRVSCNKSSQAFWKKWQNLGSSSLVQFSLSSGKSC